MALIGQIILYFIIFCAIVGCVSYLIKPQSVIAKEFTNGLYSLGHIFVGMAGIFAIIPFISQFLREVIAPIYSTFGLDVALAATSILGIDMGGYQVAFSLTKSMENLVVAMFIGFMCGTTIVFSIPLGLKIISKECVNDFGLGIMVGFVSIPFGVLVATLFTMCGEVSIRDSISTNAKSSYILNFDILVVLYNLIPLIIFCAIISLGLIYARRAMLAAFKVFGYILNAWSKVFLVLLLVEHFSGGFSYVFGRWIFDSVFADSKDLVRCLEISGYISLMLSGAFVMCVLVKKLLQVSIFKSYKNPNLLLGIFACSTNVLAGYPLLKNMNSKTRMQVVAFSVCGGFILGDDLAFSANFQPNLIFCIFAGKLLAGILAVFLAGKYYEWMMKK